MWRLAVTYAVAVAAAPRRAIPPVLARLEESGDRLDCDHPRSWLKDPQQFLPHDAMPSPA